MTHMEWVKHVERLSVLAAGARLKLEYTLSRIEQLENLLHTKRFGDMQYQDIKENELKPLEKQREIDYDNWQKAKAEQEFAEKHYKDLVAEQYSLFDEEEEENQD